MEVSATTQPAGASDADTVVLGVFDGERGKRRSAGGGRRRCSPAARRARSFKSLALAHADGVRWLLVGLGTRERADARARARRGRRRRASARASSSARALCWELPHDAGADVAAALVEGTMLADYRFERHKSAPSRRRGAAEAPRPRWSLSAPGDLSSDRRRGRARRRRRQRRARPAEPPGQRPHADRARRARRGARARDRRPVGRGRGTRGHRRARHGRVRGRRAGLRRRSRR